MQLRTGMGHNVTFLQLRMQRDIDTYGQRFIESASTREQSGVRSCQATKPGGGGDEANVRSRSEWRSWFSCKMGRTRG